MSIFDKKAVEGACSEAQLCRDYPEYFIMKYLLIAPKEGVGNFKEQCDRYGHIHIDEKVVKQYFKFFGINC